MLRLAFLCAASAAWMGPAEAQDRPPLRVLDATAFAALKATPAPDAAGGSQEWVIRWTTTTTKTTSVSQQDTFVVREHRDLAVAVVRERDPQLAADRLVVIGVDAAGSAIDWRIVPDPTVLRAEEPDATGLLSGRTLTQPAAEIRVALAADARIIDIRIYKPRWTGTAFVLEPLGTLAAAR